MGVLVQVREILLVNVLVRVRLAVVAVLMFVLDVLVVVRNVRVRVSNVSMRVFVGVGCVRHGHSYRDGKYKRLPLSLKTSAIPTVHTGKCRHQADLLRYSCTWLRNASATNSLTQTHCRQSCYCVVTTVATIKLVERQPGGQVRGGHAARTHQRRRTWRCDH